MAPVVHGLEMQYRGRVDFVYLNVALAATDSARRALGFKATPHFFLVNGQGVARDTLQGVVPGDSLRAGLDRLLAGR
jgi:thioredoxin-like negative regulator of GroEL